MKEEVFYIPVQIKTVKTTKPAAKAKRNRISAEKLKNILLGSTVIVLGILSAVISGDGTAMVVTSFIGLGAILD